MVTITDDATSQTVSSEVEPSDVYDKNDVIISPTVSAEVEPSDVSDKNDVIMETDDQDLIPSAGR